MQLRARDIARRVLLYLKNDALILDIGPASCTVAEMLMKRNLKVFPLDIQDYSIVDAVLPTIYDGFRMPFQDDQFDTALIFFVLHHSNHPQDLLVEAKRVSKKLLIYEDIITSAAHKHWTGIVDNLINLEFHDQPHTNNYDDEWQTLFRKLGFKLVDRAYNNFLLVIRQALYFL